MEASTFRSLEKTDWDFAQYVPGTSNPIHWYPGTFPGSLPATVVELLTNVGDLVFDPYSGVGTTGVEALRLGRRTWINDCNPVAQLSSYAQCFLTLMESIQAGSSSLLSKSICSELTDRYNGADLFRAEGNLDTLKSLERIIGRASAKIRPDPQQFAEHIFGYESNWEGLAKWFHPNTARGIRGILEKLFFLFEDYPVAQIVGVTAISASMRTLSSQNKSWGHIADNVLPKEKVKKDVSRTLAITFSRFGKVIKPIYLRRKGVVARITGSRWPNGCVPRHTKGSSKLLLTSPPYPGAIDYTLSQRLSLYLLGYDDREVSELVVGEMGARRKRFGSNLENVWREELLSGLERQEKFVAEDGYICFTIPHRVHRVENGFTAIKGLLDTLGWSLVFSADRAIRQERARQSWTSIKQETIAVFAKV